jgi:hypothetical protein
MTDLDRMILAARQKSRRDECVPMTPFLVPGLMFGPVMLTMYFGPFVFSAAVIIFLVTALVMQEKYG